jgi:hypothetical protein
MRFRNRVREELSPGSIADETILRQRLPAGDRDRREPARIQSLTTKRGGQSRRRPSRWACSKASVQSWKKWLRSLNPKSRTMRSRVSKCSRRTLVVRLPCMIWVNSGSVFILAIQQRGFNDSTAFRFSATTDTGSSLDTLQNGGTELFRVRRVDQYISSKGVDRGLPALYCE